MSLIHITECYFKFAIGFFKKYFQQLLVLWELLVYTVFLICLDLCTGSVCKTICMNAYLPMEFSLRSSYNHLTCLLSWSLSIPCDLPNSVVSSHHVPSVQHAHNLARFGNYIVYKHSHHQAVLYRSIGELDRLMHPYHQAVLYRSTGELGRL